MSGTIILCACYQAESEEVPIEKALAGAVDATEAIGFLFAESDGNGGCHDGCIPIDHDPENLRLFAQQTALASQSAAQVRKPRRRPLDFSDVNPKALRRGIETLQLVLRAVEGGLPVVIKRPDVRKPPGRPQAATKDFGREIK
jgi:hypothetical protein